MVMANLEPATFVGCPFLRNALSRVCQIHSLIQILWN